jgi:sulfite reductase alpha subunit-like flavoprotein
MHARTHTHTHTHTHTQTHTHALRTTQAAQAAVLAQLLAGGSEALEAYFDYTGRHVVDVLRTFPSARISISQVREHGVVVGLRT